MNKVYIGLWVAAATCLTVFFFWSDIQAVSGNRTAAVYQKEGMLSYPHKDKKKKKDKNTQEQTAVSEVPVLERWELPGELVEISGIDFTGASEVACVQDEAGTIYLYNLESRKITAKLPFAGPGDYEGIAIAGSTAYIIRADGTLFEVPDFKSGKAAVKQYSTGLTLEQDVEGLTYDAANNRLLLAIKGKDPGSKDYKGIYAFNLSTKQLNKKPVYRIQLNDAVFKKEKEKRKKEIIQPSDLAVHPTTGALYITEGTRPRLLVMDPSGKARRLYRMSTKEYTQPEGIAFNKGGELFISNEGGNGRKGTILKVAVPDR